MKPLQSRLLLVSVCAFSSWSVSSGPFVVTQSSDVSVLEGDTVDIICCWREDFEKVTVNWMKNQTQIKSDSGSTKTMCLGSLHEERCQCSMLTLTEITSEASGAYVCRVTVEIPVYTVVEGNGTVVTVMVRQNTGVAIKHGVVIPELVTQTNLDNQIMDTDDAFAQDDALINIIRCLPILALVFTFFYLYQSARKAQQTTPDMTENKPRPVQIREEAHEAEDQTERETQTENEENRLSND